MSALPSGPRGKDAVPGTLGTQGKPSPAPAFGWGGRFNLTRAGEQIPISSVYLPSGQTNEGWALFRDSSGFPCVTSAKNSTKRSSITGEYVCQLATRSRLNGLRR